MLEGLVQILQIVLIVVGFGGVVVIHELGHFLAARWAGVRVLAFAVGFGPAVFSWRKGMGFRRGSSAEEYQALVYTAQGEGGEAREAARSALAGRVSPTEYRLNWVPLGGYVKMLGQDDADPSHRSDEPDSYNSVAIWKRMVIISAGVAANMVSAAALFVVVFALGLEKPRAIVGGVEPGSPAALAVRADGGPAGLRAGDAVVSIGGERPRSFDDVSMAVLTSRDGRPLEIEIRRPGVEGALVFEAEPSRSELGIRELGIGAAGTTKLLAPSGAADREAVRALLDSAGLGAVGPGWEIVAVDGEPVAYWHEVSAIADSAGGEPIEVVFESPDGDRVVSTVGVSPSLMLEEITHRGDVIRVGHLAGLAPVMTVGAIEESSPGYAAGLRRGDVFVRLGGVDYPDAASGIAAVRDRAGETIAATVRRGDALIELELAVSRRGVIGFGVGGTDSLEDPAVSLLVTSVPGLAAAVTRPGSRVVSVDGVAVTSFSALAARLQALARRSGEGGLAVDLAIESPLRGADGERVETVERIAFDAGQTDALATLGWSPPAALGLVEPATVLLRSEGPVEAIAMGLDETKRIMLTTYLTFVRLAQGSIAPRVLNGPVGIVHIGSSIADRGLAWMLFFFALVSVNLAVINFLPIPITDGGHMVFLVWEQVTGRPVSVAVQNAATLAGLVLIVGAFLFVTYHDVVRLIGS